MKRIKKKTAEILQRCAWCGVQVVDGMPFGAIPLKLNQTVTTKSLFLPTRLPQCGKTVNLLLVTEDSQAKTEGWDALLLVCGEDCGRKMTAALGKEGIMTVSELN
jgi:hypothetical protein